jgi:hypothetical protein
MPPQPPAPASNPLPPISVPSLTADDLKSPDALNSILLNFGQSINYILGHAGGPPVLKAGVDLGGATIRNSGAPQSPSDVVSLEFADNNYGASAIAPQVEALGKNILQTYRQLNNPVQRERTSSYLNDIANTSPTANTATLASSVTGGTVDITVSSGNHQYMDGSNVPFSSRTDTFNLPNGAAISSASRSGGVVTLIVSSGPWVAGESIEVYGTAAASFQGIFTILTVTSVTIITYNQAGPNTSTSGGTVSAVNAYYYTRIKGQGTLAMSSAPAADTWSARVPPSYDGITLIAVVIVNNAGMDGVNSAAGDTPPVTGASIPVLRRL